MPQAEAESQEVVNTEVEQESTQAESTAAETQNSEASSEPDTKAVISDSGEVVRVKVDNSKEEESEDKSDDDPKPKRGKEARQGQLERDLDEENRAIRELVARRNQARAYRQQLEQEQAQQYQETPPEMQNQPLPTLEQTGDFFTEFEAKAVLQNLQLQQQITVMQEAQEQAAYEAQVSASINGMSSDAERALKDFPEFDPESDEYDPELDANVDEFLQGMLIYDNAGNIVGSRESIYQLYQSFHKARGKGAKRTVINDAGDFRGSGARVEKPFEKMSTKEMEAYLRRKGHDV